MELLIEPLHGLLIDIGRIGIGAIFLFSIGVDYATRSTVFELMRKKHVPFPSVFYIGATCWKFLTSAAIVCNYYTYWASLLLALYIFLANIVFNNFWSVEKERRAFSLVLFVVYLGVCFGLLVVAGVSSE